MFSAFSSAQNVDASVLLERRYRLLQMDGWMDGGWRMDGWMQFIPPNSNIAFKFASMVHAGILQFDPGDLTYKTRQRLPLPTNLRIARSRSVDLRHSLLPPPEAFYKRHGSDCVGDYYADAAHSLGNEQVFATTWTSSCF